MELKGKNWLMGILFSKLILSTHMTLIAETSEEIKDEVLPQTATSAWALGLIGLVSTTSGLGINKKCKK